MGKYLQCGTIEKGKAAYLLAFEHAMEIPFPDAFDRVPAGYTLICVVENPMWDAALVIDTRSEYRYVKQAIEKDYRPRRCFLMLSARVKQLIGDMKI